MPLRLLALLPLLLLSSPSAPAASNDPALLWAPMRFEGEKHLSIRRLVNADGAVNYDIKVNPNFVYQDAIIKAPLRCSPGSELCFDLEVRAIEVVWGLEPDQATKLSGFRIEGESIFRILKYARLETSIDTQKSGFIRVQSYGGDHYLVLITKVVPILKVSAQGEVG